MPCVKLVCFLPGNMKYICLFTIVISCTLRLGDITGVQLVQARWTAFLCVFRVRAALYIKKNTVLIYKQLNISTFQQCKWVQIKALQSIKGPFHMISERVESRYCLYTYSWRKTILTGNEWVSLPRFSLTKNKNPHFYKKLIAFSIHSTKYSILYSEFMCRSKELMKC